MTVNVSASKDILSKVVDVDRSILVPLPFLRTVPRLSRPPSVTA